MKLFSILLYAFFLQFQALAQQDNRYHDSLYAALNNAQNDTARMDLSRQLGFFFQEGNTDTALAYHNIQLSLAQKLNLKIWEADAYQQIAYCYLWLDNLPLSFEYYMKALKITGEPSHASNGWGFENFSYSRSPADALLSIAGMTHFELNSLFDRSRQNAEQRKHLFEAYMIGEQLHNLKILSLSTRDIGNLYFDNNQPDSALYYYRKSLMYYQYSPYQRQIGFLYQLIARYYVKQQTSDSARHYFLAAISINESTGNLKMLGSCCIEYGGVYKSAGNLDSALFYTLKGIRIAESISDYLNVADGNIQLSSIYKLQLQPLRALEALEKGKSISDAISDAYINKLIQFQNAGFDQKLRLQELEKERLQTKSRIRTLALLGGLGVFLAVALLLYRNNRQKQKANAILQSTLNDLRSAQSQLIQSEKMASLGELTAGIAHEIQNPLNFVNNFSEVNSELIDEMTAEIDLGKWESVKLIAKDIKENQEKINQHGKRADAIVKGMLQHSRTSNGQMEPTDLNALADEYFRLAYHGLRARDKSFNATMKTAYEEGLQKVNVVPQDIGRVVLNLITNAFYVVNEKKNSGVDGYEPTVTVSTKKAGDKIELSVKDNGSGIPEKVLEKIFQPFFTTKPTGQGTGLGLSLSYDIVRAHGGELKVQTKENEGSEFIIQLPA